MSNNPQFERELKDISSTEIFKRAKHEKKGVVEYISLVDGREKIGAFYSLENGWKVWVSRDIREMKSDTMESFRDTMIIGISGLFLILVFGYFLSLQISLPIRRLKDNALALSSGRFEIGEQREYRGIVSEIRDLSDTFFNMAAELKRLYKASKIL